MDLHPARGQLAGISPGDYVAHRVAGEHVTFVPAKRKNWMSRRNKTGHHTRSRDEAERDVYLDDSASEVTDDFDYW